MARKKFLQDVEQVKQKPPAHITHIERYDGDGLSFVYWYERGNVTREIDLKLITTNVDEYPDHNEFMLFTEDLDVDPLITDSFVQIQAIIDGASLSTALREISDGLHQALTLGLAENPISLPSSSQRQSASDINDFEIDEQGYDEDDASFGLNEILPLKPTTTKPNGPRNKTSNASMDAIRHDLRAAKDAGFKIGVHGDLSSAGIVCVSIRVSKLGISEEAMQAWGLVREQYLVLLIRFQQGYKFASDVKDETNLSGAVEMRVGLSDTYKPRVEEVFAAFNQVQDKNASQSVSQLQSMHSKKTGSFQPLFIGRPINDLLRDRFPKILKFRHQFGLPWSGAEKMFNDRQGALLSDLSRDLSAYQYVEDVAKSHTLPNIVLNDTLSNRDISEASLPLIAMQFVVRHLVRCTEFCLVCHCRVEDTFEALKPYVCSNPLCLYQFMALGFGPAAEWEILSQPYVVDLLVSLCYAQAQFTRIKEFPLGVSLKVPLLPHYKRSLSSVPQHHMTLPASRSSKSTVSTCTVSGRDMRAFTGKFDSQSALLSPTPDSWAGGKQNVKIGDWIVLVTDNVERYETSYCRIAEEKGLGFILNPVIHGTQTVHAPKNLKHGEIKATTQYVKDVDCYLYNYNFDELPVTDRHHAILALLDTLPSVVEMRKCLVQQQGGHRDANLNLLRSLCPQAALDLLRWIIASNRSCIMQVDQVAAGDDASQRLKPSEDRVSGMDEWMQFRFAQGAPDKEQRFVDCIKASSISTQHPTLFAWHGSPLYNWHSIIRQGLNFDEILHGRASGHGVYMSPHVVTSMGYADRSHQAGSLCWSNSTLKVTSVVSLQEVVNNVAHFTSSTPHFVVAEKDWIQTRYLFVKTSVRHSTGGNTKLVYEQDPSHPALGIDNKPVSIPMTAISKARRPGELLQPVRVGQKRKSMGQELADSDDGSVTTDEGDRELLRVPNEDTDGFDDDGDDDVVMTDVDDWLESVTQNTVLSGSSVKRSLEKSKEFILDKSKTNFVPGALDLTGIRFLDPPKDASISASRALMRAFSETVKVQKQTPLHDLGFYVDPNRMDNMYQWIVELHSFDSTLPLARDMQSAGFKSIVLEMQFTNDFPFSPPFVRVVKPRFLDPMMGGGGHITSGGAICMELLTSSGWSAVNSIESVLLQVRLAMTERDRPARLLSSQGRFNTTPYAIGEAIAAYRRFCIAHGWQAPKGLDSLLSI